MMMTMMVYYQVRIRRRVNIRVTAACTLISCIYPHLCSMYSLHINVISNVLLSSSKSSWFHSSKKESKSNSGINLSLKSFFYIHYLSNPSHPCHAIIYMYICQHENKEYREGREIHFVHSLIHSRSKAKVQLNNNSQEECKLAYIFSPWEIRHI